MKKIEIFVLSIVFVICLFKLFYNISQFSEKLLTWDEIDIVDTILYERNPFTLFTKTQWGHRVGVGLIILKPLVYFTNWDNRVQMYMAGGILAVSSILALLLKYRLTKFLSTFDVIIPLIFLSTFQTLNLDHGYQFMYVLPLLFLMLILLLFTYQWSFKRNICICFVAFLSAYCMIQGLFIIVIINMYLVYEYLSNRSNSKNHNAPFNDLFVLIVINFIGLTSFINYPIKDNVRLTNASFIDYLHFSIDEINNFFLIHPMNASRYIIPAVLFLIFGLFIWNFLKTHNKKTVIISGLYLESIYFIIFTALSRIDVQEGYAFTSYITYLIPLFFASYLSILLIKPTLLRNYILTVLLVPFLFLYITGEGKSRDSWTFNKTVRVKWRACFLKNYDIQLCDKESGYRIYIEGREDFLFDKMLKLKQNKLNIFSD